MRFINVTRHIARGIAALLLLHFTTGILASEAADRVRHPGAGGMTWVCDYSREADGVLYLRCHDLKSLIYDDLVPLGETPPSRTQYVPLWAKPKSDNSAVNLAERVLCRQGSSCTVELAGTVSTLELAMF